MKMSTAGHVKYYNLTIVADNITSPSISGFYNNTNVTKSNAVGEGPNYLTNGYWHNLTASSAISKFQLHTGVCAQILPAFDTINITVTAVSTNTSVPNVVFSKLYEAVLDQISTYSVTVTPIGSPAYSYPLGQVITVTVNLPEAIAIDHLG